MKCVLVDTSFIVALLDKGEQHHATCKKLLGSVGAPLLTCEAVIAESCYLLRNLRGAADAVLANVAAGILQIPFDLSINAGRVREIMRQYSNIPANLADSCLVALAEEYDTGLIQILGSIAGIRTSRSVIYSTLGQREAGGADSLQQRGS